MASSPSSSPEPIPIPRWLETLPDAPVYRPTLSDFSDPISFISRIEHHASRFGICKIMPPLPKPPKSSVLRHLHDSLHAAPFTTRHQELGSKKPSKTKQVWQSGEFYSLEQFEAKSKSFARSQLHGLKEVTPLLVESLFWDAVAEKPITVEYANDVPGSAFAPRRRRKRKREEGASWSLADSPWNLQVIARSPGSLTRFMPDDIPGVTSPMVYIAMLFSWFAWHVEDHELHSLNFLHMGAPKTWYAVPGEHAASLEEVVRVKGYGGNVDRLAAFMMLGEKTTLLSPEVLVEAGIPCCRLVQYPGEFVVTFPRAYHIGFSHGFNCGEAANFATPQWLNVAKEAAVRRAAMNHLPMLSHQQLLYMLTTSFISRVPRPMLQGVRTSRLRDREKERELLIKRAFLNDMMDENDKLHILLEKESIPGVLLWEPELLPSTNGSHSSAFSSALGAQSSAINDEHEREILCYDPKLKDLSNMESDNCCKENFLLGGPASLTSVPLPSKPSCIVEKDVRHTGCMSSYGEAMEKTDDDAENELPFGLHVDSGTLACVACGILGYPFMAIVHPSEIILEELASLSHGEYNQRLEHSEQFKTCLPSYAPPTTTNSCSVDLQESGVEVEELPNQESVSDSASRLCDHADTTDGQCNKCGSQLLKIDIKESSCNAANVSMVIDGNLGPDGYTRPRIFCLQHATEVAELLQYKGSRVLIICHSDYLKIKALAIAVAEEIGMQFNFKDFPIMDASPADLDLINVSIDDEAQEDWTSKLGINLSYFIKVRRQLPSNQEPLPISLSRIFSDPPPISVVSNLKWHCKRSRTSYKVIGAVHSMPNINPDAAVEEAVLENLKADSLEANKVYLRCKRGASALHIKHHGECVANRTTGFISNKETMMVDEGYDDNRNSGIPRSKDHMEAFCTESLVTVPVFAAKSFPIHEPSWSQKISTSLLTSDSVEICRFVLHVDVATEDSEKHLGIDSDEEAVRMFGSGSVKPGCSQSSSDVSTLGNFALHQNEVGEDVDTSSHEVGNSEFQVNVVIQEVEHFEALKKIKPVDDNSPHKSDGTLTPDGERTPQKHLNIPEHLQENVVAHKSSLVDNLRKSTMEEDDDNCGIVIVDSEVQDDDIPHALESTEQCYSEDHKLQLGENLVMDVAIVDGSEMKWKIESATSPQGVGEFSSCVESEGLHDVISVLENSESPLEASYSADAKMKHVEDNLVELENLVDAVKGLVAEKVNQNTAGVYSVPERASLHNASEKIRPIIVYKRTSRSKKKQMIEAEMMTTDQHSSNEFIRSPCEGLRPRTGRAAIGTGEAVVVSKVASKPRKRQDSSIGRRSKHLAEGTFKCEIEGCHISFRTKRELDRHHDNRCIFKGCGKRFSSHMLAVRHQRAHEDERPLKCPWRGCNMSFKWAWARTEHVRLHTGERPYKCKVAGCGLTFRFVSDFSRHRRKTGHYGNSKT